MGVRVTVVDDGGALGKPYVRDEPGAPDGRGLGLVQALSDRWGADEGERGWAVWAEFGGG